jgi:hypothetical protein
MKSSRLVFCALLVVAALGCGKKKSNEAASKPAEPEAADPGPGSAPLKGAKAQHGGRDGSEPFTPSTQGFKFQNYGNEDGIENLTPAEVVRMFGASVCADETDDGACVLTPAAERWMEETNKSMSGGHCEGLAAVALLFEQKKLDAASFGAPIAFELELAGNQALQHEVAFWFSTQFLAPMSRAEIRTLTPNQVVDKLTEAFTSGSESYTIGIYMRDGSGGHATTPYAIVEKSPTETWIMHYDNNFPGEERHIDVDRTANTWTYFTAADPKEPGATYDGDAETFNLTIAPTSVRIGAMTCPFCGEVDDAADDAARAKGSRQVWMDGEGDLLIEDGAGHKLGMENGALVNTIPDATTVEVKASSRRADAEPIYQLPAEPMTVTLDGSRLEAEEPSDVTVLAPGYTMGVYGVELEPGHKDVLEFSGDWQHMSYTTDEAETPDLELGIATTGADYEFIIRAGGESGGQRIEITLDTKAGTISVQAHAHDDTAGYEVEVHRIDDHGEQTFKHQGVSAGADDALVFAYGAWTGDGGAMKVGLDHGHDGSIDEEEELGDE